MNGSKNPTVICKSLCPFFKTDPSYFPDDASMARNLSATIYNSSSLSELVYGFSYLSADFKQKQLSNLMGFKNIHDYSNLVSDKFG
jgi:hypothetical protein